MGHSKYNGFLRPSQDYGQLIESRAFVPCEAVFCQALFWQVNVSVLPVVVNIVPPPLKVAVEFDAGEQVQDMIAPDAY